MGSKISSQETHTGSLVFGYHGQAVAHAAHSKTIRFFTPNGGDGACDVPAYTFDGANQLGKFNTALYNAIGRGFDDYQRSYRATAFNIDHGPLTTPQLGDIDVRDLRSSESFEPGQLGWDDGIENLISNGAIRPATPSDIDEANAARARAGAKNRLEANRPRIYLVLRSFTVPKGMYGAHSATFLIPAGIARPLDKGSHNRYISLVDGSSTGP